MRKEQEGLKTRLLEKSDEQGKLVVMRERTWLPL